MLCDVSMVRWLICSALLQKQQMTKIANVLHAFLIWGNSFAVLLLSKMISVLQLILSCSQPIRMLRAVSVVNFGMNFSCGDWVTSQRW